MGAVKSQLETSHQEDLNDLTARFLAETAIKVETTRLETEQDWQVKLDEMKQNHEIELQTMAEKLTQVSDYFSRFWRRLTLSVYSRTSLIRTEKRCYMNSGFFRATVVPSYDF